MCTHYYFSRMYCCFLQVFDYTMEVCHDIVQLSDKDLACSNIHDIPESSCDVQEEQPTWADFSKSFSGNEGKNSEVVDSNWASFSSEPVIVSGQDNTPSNMTNTSRNNLFSTSSDDFGEFDWQGPVSAKNDEEDLIGRWKRLSLESFGVPQSDPEMCKSGDCTSPSLNKAVVDSKLWNEVSLGMFNPRPELWSHPSISKGYDTAVGCICARLATGNVPSGVDHTDGSSKKHRRQNSRRVSECLSSLSDDFEWNNDDSEPFLLNLKGLSSGNLSPESATMTAYVRSNVVSPVEVEMDISRATEGLSVLSEEELEVMVGEMQTKFSRLAETLVSELERREKLIASRGVRNQFISSWHQLVQHKQNASPSRKLSVKELKKWASSVKSISDEKSPQKYMYTVIPYVSRGVNTPWDLETLQKLTRIVNAIFNNLDVVPALLREYITECMDIEDSGTYS